VAGPFPTQTQFDHRSFSEPQISTNPLGSRIKPSGPWDCAEDSPIRVNTRLVATTRQPMALLENMLISFLRYDMSARGAVIKTNSCPRVMTRIKQIVFRS